MKKLNTRGLALIQVLLMTALVGIFSLGLTSVLKIQSKEQYEMNLKVSVAALRQSLINIIANQQAWEKTKNKNPDMNCTSSSQIFCSPSQFDRKAFKLFDADGNLVYDATNKNSGFTANGLPCLDFDEDKGNPSCPIHVDLQWRAVCSGTPCSSQEDFIALEFAFKAGNKDFNVPFNPRNYSMAEQPRLQINSQSSPILVCSKIGKAFIGKGQTFNGYAADGQGCIPLLAFQGPAGPAGPTGATGPMGPQGPPGPTGTCP